MSKKQLVYICGSGHSGSTLLDMLLGGHDQISCLGEIHRLYLGANRSESNRYLCTCGKPILVCPFWYKVSQELQELLGVHDPDIFKTFVTTEPRYLEVDDGGAFYYQPSRYISYPYSLNRLAMIIGSKQLWSMLAFVSKDVRMHRRIISNSLTLYEAVHRARGTPIIVDSTKNPVRLKGLYLASHETFRLLHLIRDGRAVCYSRMKRENLPMEKCVRIWKAEYRKLRLTQLSIPKAIITRVCYEDLCRNPERELSLICKVLGIEFQRLMLEFRSNDIHSIGGNPMRFRSNDTKIRPDDRWRHEIRPEDLGTFERIAGKLNRSFGYVD